MDRPTKTFELSTPMDVFEKLEYDLKRLKQARYTNELQYAALDLAIWSFHLIEWVLYSVDDRRHIELCGKARGKGDAVKGFVERQSIRMGTLKFCHQVAIAGKHRTLTRTPDDPSFRTSHAAWFDPPFVADQPNTPRLVAIAYFEDTSDGRQLPAVDLFVAAIEQWRAFLKAEGLYNWDYDRPETDPE